MLAQILIGSGIISLTIFVVAGFVGLATKMLDRIGPWFTETGSVFRLILATTGVTLWMLAALGASVWIWAGGFIVLGIFDDIELSLYFSAVSFTTLGFGDVVLPPEWRLLSGFVAANGLILFSLVTAFLIAAVRGLQDGSGAPH